MPVFIIAELLFTDVRHKVIPCTVARRYLEKHCATAITATKTAIVKRVIVRMIYIW